MDNSDTVTYKLKKKKKRKENNSNNSKESLEMEINTLKKSKTISKKKAGEGEEIKFFFNEPPILKFKTSKFKAPSIQTKRTQKSNLNLSTEKNEFNFKDFLLNYVNSPERQTKKNNGNEQIEKRSSVIYGNPEINLTLNGDEDSKISEEKADNNEKNSSSNSHSDSLSKNSSKSEEIYSNEDSSKVLKNKNKQKKSKESSYNLNESKYAENMNSNNSNKIEEEDINEKEKLNENEENKKGENDEFKKNMLKNMKSSESINHLKSNKDSCFNSYKNSQIKSSNNNTFTTATNTYNSFQSLKINNKKLNYNYLNWNDLSFTTKLKIKKRASSTKKIDSIKENIKNNFIKNENTSIMIYKLKHLNISLDIEKSYINYFKNLSSIQNQKNHYKSFSSEYINNSNNQIENKIENNIKNNIYYPDVYYINNNNNLHNKIHVSNFFDKLKTHKNNF